MHSSFIHQVKMYFKFNQYLLNVITVVSVFLILPVVDIYCDQFSADLDTLKSVQVIFRHGERVPEYHYPNDPYNGDDFWKEGWGQLTEKGKGQAYHVGTYLKTRYDKFLSEHYLSSEMYVLSSNSERAMICAQLCCNGIYTTANGTSWNPDVKWQPVPVRMIDAPIDNLLTMQKPCPKYSTELEDYLKNSPEMKEINEENKEMFDILTIGSGVNVSNVVDIYKFYGTMDIEEQLGFPLPSWAEPIVHTENFQYLYNISFSVKTRTLSMKRLRTGQLLKYLVDNIQSKVSNSSTSSKSKFHLLSAHDSTIVSLLDTLGVFDLQRVGFAAIFMLELHQHSSSEDYFVQILLKNETDNEAYILKIPGCDFKCPLETFLNYTSVFIPEDWESECQLEFKTEEIEKESCHSFVDLIAAIVIAVFTFFIGILVYFLSRRKLQKTTSE